MANTEGFVDAHCHIDLFENPASVVAESEREHVYTIAVTNAPSVFEHTEALAKGCKYVRPALGLHPELVCSHGQELAQFRLLIGRTRYIGEVGLDYVTSNRDDRAAQRTVFNSILTLCADSEPKVLTIHSRRAAKDVIEALGDRFPGKAILHWFTGTSKELECAIRAGCYFSVNPSMAGSERGKLLVARMPRERVLTETDAPFVHVQNRPASPLDVKRVLPVLASMWGIETQEAEGVVMENFRQVLAQTTEPRSP
jgi:TatD DNase family protein